MVLEKLLANTILVSVNQQYITIFVNALDKAGAKTTQQLAEYFHQLIGHTRKKKLALRIYILYRHYSIIESTRTTEIYIEDHNQENIAIYIKNILINTETGDNYNQEIRDILIEQLIHNINRIFQWTYFIILLIKQRILEKKLIEDICSWLRKVPADFEDIYIYLLNKIIIVQNRNQLFILFQWIYLAEQPLTVTEMQYILTAENA